MDKAAEGTARSPQPAKQVMPTDAHIPATTTYVPDLLYVGGRFERGRGLVCDADGRIVAVTSAEIPEGFTGGENVFVETEPGVGVRVGRVIRLRNRAMLPGMVNAHSHAFQRVIRGRTEYRGAHASDSFWTWREMMYAAAERLTPDDIYDASRMAFMEMVLSGITSVGEFHYLHRTPEGGEYDDPNLLARQVVRAAHDVGLRIALLRVAYARAGYRKEPDPRQQRFIEPEPVKLHLQHHLAHTLPIRAGLVRVARVGRGRAAQRARRPHRVPARGECVCARGRRAAAHARRGAAGRSRGVRGGTRAHARRAARG